jgi:3-oxoacyl-[acyl-carrier-protein] synthase II
MRLALEAAGIEPGEVGSIWASSAGLRAADRPEQRAIVRLFGDDARVVTPKLRLGEPIGAGGSLNTVLALQSWQHGERPGPAVVNSSSLGGTHF